MRPHVRALLTLVAVLALALPALASTPSVAAAPSVAYYDHPGADDPDVVIVIGTGFPPSSRVALTVQHLLDPGYHICSQPTTQ